MSPGAGNYTCHWCQQLYFSVCNWNSPTPTFPHFFYVSLLFCINIMYVCTCMEDTFYLSIQCLQYVSLSFKSSYIWLMTNRTPYSQKYNRIGPLGGFFHVSSAWARHLGRIAFANISIYKHLNGKQTCIHIIWKEVLENDKVFMCTFSFFEKHSIFWINSK